MPNTELPYLTPFEHKCFNALPKGSKHAIGADLIIKKLKTFPSTFYSTINVLIKHGLVVRTGKGGRFEPFRYYIPNVQEVVTMPEKIEIKEVNLVENLASMINEFKQLHEERDALKAENAALKLRLENVEKALLD